MVLDTLKKAKAETSNDTLVNVQAKSVIDTPPEPLSEMNTKTLGDTLANVDVVVLLDMPAESLFETNVARIGDTIENVMSEELSHTLTDTLENRQIEQHT